jgi:hypothetical protein
MMQQTPQSTKWSVNGTGVLEFEPSLQFLKQRNAMSLLEPLTAEELKKPSGRNLEKEFAVEMA